MSSTVSVVVIGEDPFISAPGRLCGRLDAEEPADLESLVRALGGDVEEVVGEARLLYGDEGTLRLIATDEITAVEDHDVRLAVLDATSDPGEWSEASAGEPCDRRFGIVQDNSLLAVGTVRVWDDLLGHVGVFTVAHAHGRGLAARVGSAAVEYALTLGCVPQWRSRIGNQASVRVADKLGFVDLGKQMTVRVRASS